jgi:methionyl-tRNA formyltransferase
MTKKLNIIFMGTPEFALPALSAIHNSHHKLVAVYTQPPRPAGRGQKDKKSPIQEFAIANDIAVYTPISLRDVVVQNELKNLNADVIVVAAYGLLLPQAVLDACQFGCINIHPSLLPRWRGAAPIQRTIMAGDKETGVVIMQMNAGLDTGDALLTKKITIPDNCTSGRLHDILAKISADLVLEVLSDIENATPVRQAEIGVTYAAKISKEECLIDWNNDAVDIYNKILGLLPQPKAFFIYNDEQIKIIEAEIIENNHQQPAGTIIDDKLTIACKNDYIRILKLQRAGKNPMLTADMLRGYKNE